jgi:ABC-type multidrug transport system ATPase subunit/pSer/pThr/pTyr-binding forkhead associated (FHA) protein
MSNEGSALIVPTLRIISPGGERVVSLAQDNVRVGRSSDNEVCIKAEVVSSSHARLVREGATYRFFQVGHTNSTLLRGTPVDDYRLQHGDRLEIAPGTPRAVTLIFELPSPGGGATLGFTRPFRLGEEILTPGVGQLALQRAGVFAIGRSGTCDLVLPSLTVSRVHARLEVADGAVRIEDAGSANGTFLNGVRITRRMLSAGDILRIGPYKLVYQPGAMEHYDDSRAVRLDACDVRKTIGRKMILESVTFSAQPKEVLAIAGTSGAGKSTLLDALNGMRPPTSGHVLVNGADLYRAFDALRPLIGYVPQENILPAQLPLERALYYVARLRLPADVSEADANERVEEVMRALDLLDRRNVAIGLMSGGQQKRASIAAELISNPGLFFLDEPTSGLDPGLTWRVTEIVRELATAGSTVVVISHDVESLLAADKILFLASGGRVVFIGSPEEALHYFNVANFAEIYPRIEDEDSSVLEGRFRESEQYRLRVAPGLVQAAPSEHEGAPTEPAWDPVALFSLGARQSASASRQFRVTAARYAESLLRDRRNLVLLLAQAPVIAFFLSVVASSNGLSPPPASALAQAAALGIRAAKLAPALPVMMAATATWFGAINAAREIVKELPILQRERLAGLRIVPYLASKLAVLMVLCVIQSGVLLAVVATKVHVPTSGAIFPAWFELWLSLDLAAFTALGWGLLISASVPNADRAQSLVPIVLIPQLIFVGGPGTGTLGRWLSYLTVTHWASQAMKITLNIPYGADGAGFGAAQLLVQWGALAVMMSVLLVLTTWRLSRQRSG